MTRRQHKRWPAESVIFWRCSDPERLGVKVKRYCSSIVSLLLLLVAPSTARADEVDDYLRAQMERNHIPGLSVAIVRDGKVVKLKGYGLANLEWDAPVTPDTAFQLASATKPLTGTALMLLVEEGKIALDDRISKYLPDAPQAWSGITVQHLVTHSSGIRDDLGQKKVTTVEDAVKAAAELPLAYRPGEKSAYGLSDYVVLMHIIERVAGKPFQTFLRERLFDPLGISATRFDNMVENGPIRTSDVVKRRASVYNWEGGTQQTFAFLYAPWAYSAGGLYASAADLATWVVALDTGRLLKKESREQMWAGRKLGGGKENPFGMGWVIGSYHGRRTAGHSGGPALADILRFIDDKLTIIVLTNQEKLYPHLAQGVADQYVPTPPLEGGGIEDNDPNTTLRLKAVLLDAAQGKVDPTPFTPEAQAGFVPALKNFGPVYFDSLDPLRSFVLIEQKDEGHRRIRRYRALFGRKSVIWTFELTEEGKIISIEPRAE